MYGSIQCPYYVHKALVTLGGAVTRVRVVQTETGGGFGGKEEYPSMLAGHASPACPQGGTPGQNRVRPGRGHAGDHQAASFDRAAPHLSKDGRLVAMDVDIILDAGAYVTLSPVVLSRGAIHAAGPYRCPNTRITARAMLTNTPPNGAFRGFGAPQTEFAIEVHMERIAETLGMDSARLRERNALRPGDTTATGQRLGEDCSARQVLREAMRKSGYWRKRKAFAGRPGNRSLALLSRLRLHRQRELKLASRASVELTATGVRTYLQHRDRSGTRTMHAQIVADALGIPYEQVEVAQPDTSVVPDSGPTVASRTCMIVGDLRAPRAKCANGSTGCPRWSTSGIMDR